MEDIQLVWGEIGQNLGYDLIGRKARGSFGMEFQEQEVAEARVVSGAASSAGSAWLSGQDYRIRTSIKGLEQSEDQDHNQDQDQDKEDQDKEGDQEKKDEKGDQEDPKDEGEDKEKKDKSVQLKSFDELEKEARKEVLKNMDNLYLRIEELEHQDWFSTFLNSIVEGFDPHTSYMDPRVKERFDQDMSGKLEGIGARLYKKGIYFSS